MNIISLKQLFKNTLLNIYPPEEINTFFELCCEHYLKLDKIIVHTQPEKVISSGQIQQMEKALERLKNEEPVQYILGRTFFYGLHLKVNISVLIPRPETEYLTDIIVTEEKNRELQILDIGTGSGCIALALAANLSKASVWGLDKSEEALKVARDNAVKNQIENIKFIQDDILSPMNTMENLDVIVSNPPYVEYQEKAKMKKNVLYYEPEQALFVEDNHPLLYYEAILAYAANALESGGRIYLEINEKHGDKITKMLIGAGYSHTKVMQDLNKNVRFVKGIKQ